MIIVVGALLLFVVMIFRVSQLALAEEIDGVNCEVLKSYEAYEFPFPNLRAISKVYNADELPFDGKSYFLTL